MGDPWFALYMCFVMPAQIASFFWGEPFWNAFFVAGALRYCVVLHFTWLVNSAAHLYGDHPYDVLSYPAENPIVSFCSIGEGWHNWHHKYPFDYAASEFGISKQFNPSKLVIDVFSMLGLEWERKEEIGMQQMVYHYLKLRRGRGKLVRKKRTNLIKYIYLNMNHILLM